MPEKKTVIGKDGLRKTVVKKSLSRSERSRQHREGRGIESLGQKVVDEVERESHLIRRGIWLESGGRMTFCLFWVTRQMPAHQLGITRVE